MENKEIQCPSKEALAILTSSGFLRTPVWGEFFYFASSREELINLYEAFLDEGCYSLEQPHENASGIFLAKLRDQKGRHLLLRSE